MNFQERRLIVWNMLFALNKFNQILEWNFVILLFAISIHGDEEK